MSQTPPRSPVLEGTADVRAFMTRELVLAPPDERVETLLGRMNQGRFQHALIVAPEPDRTASNGRAPNGRAPNGRVPNGRVPVEALLGIVSALDLLERLRENTPLELCRLRAREVMTSAPLITVSSGTSLEQALETLCSHSVSALPVLEHGLLVGVVTSEDILDAVAQARAVERPGAAC